MLLVLLLLQDILIFEKSFMFIWNFEGYKISHVKVPNQELHMKII
jgi:hypothetical protein